MKTTSSEHVVYIIFFVFVLTFSGVESDNISQKRTKEYTITTFLHRIELGNRLGIFIRGDPKVELHPGFNHHYS